MCNSSVGIERRDPPCVVIVARDEDTLGRYSAAVRAVAPVTVITVLNCLAALAKIAAFRPILVLTDLEFPVLDGYQMIEIVNRDRAFQALPIVAISDDPGASRLRKQLDERANVSVIAPNDERLSAALRSLLCHSWPARRGTTIPPICASIE